MKNKRKAWLIKLKIRLRKTDVNKPKKNFGTSSFKKPEITSISFWQCLQPVTHSESGAETSPVSSPTPPSTGSSHGPRKPWSQSLNSTSGTLNFPKNTDQPSSITSSTSTCQSKPTQKNSKKNLKGKTSPLPKITSISLKLINSHFRLTIKILPRWSLVIKTVLKSSKKPKKQSPFSVMNSKWSKRKLMLKKFKSKPSLRKSRLPLKKLINCKRVLSPKRKNSIMKVLKSKWKVKRLRKFSFKPSPKSLRPKRHSVSLILKNSQLLSHCQNLQTKSLNWVSQFCIWNQQALKMKKEVGTKSEEWFPIHQVSLILWKVSVNVLEKWQTGRFKSLLKDSTTNHLNSIECKKFQSPLTTC